MARVTRGRCTREGTLLEGTGPLEDTLVWRYRRSTGRYLSIEYCTDTTEAALVLRYCGTSVLSIADTTEARSSTEVLWYSSMEAQ